MRNWPAGIAGIAPTSHSPLAQRADRHRGGSARCCTTAASITDTGASSMADGGTEKASHSNGNMGGRRGGG